MYNDSSEMTIYIPSLNRYKEQKTLMLLPEEIRKERCHLVVHKSEVDEYRERWEEECAGFLVLPDGGGISRVRKEIMYCCPTPYLCMLDDDLKFYQRREVDKWNLRDAEPDEIGAMLWWIETQLKLGYYHVGVSAREGNNRLEGFTDRNVRQLRVLAFRNRDIIDKELVVYERVPVMEDFDVTLQLLRQGYANIVSVHWAQGQSMTQAEGGCSEWRTHEVHTAGAEKLAELHNGFVTLREKKNKHGGEFGKRKEVTIAWKQAYREGQRRRQEAEENAL